ncbi:MAG TPA: formylglycine-generating enzyme family protein [Anaerolineae bacterium]|nr:formylglycine-generating enzyme family protein [Anaerolineae bacterium]HPL27209.1 formylglycine-generating enzyme family protein [Anaerolineae bacterium]
MKRMIALLALLVLLLAGCAPAAGAPAAALLTLDTGVSPEAWARVPAGPFLMGQHEHEMLVDYDYEVMVTPVTNAQYARYLNEALAKGTVKIADGWVVGHYDGDPFSNHRHEKEIAAGDWPQFPLANEDARLTFDGQAFAVRPGYEMHPVTMVTWFGAKGYSDFYGYRLPTEVEWEKAARGTDGRAYPWGAEIAGHNANYSGSGDPFERNVGKLGNTTPVGFYNGKTYDGYATVNSPSPYGLYDMAGNVWEWTADVNPGAHYRFMRGGSRADYGFDLRVWTRNNAEPHYASPSVGFRCVRTVTK